MRKIRNRVAKLWDYGHNLIFTFYEEKFVQLWESQNSAKSSHEIMREK